MKTPRRNFIKTVLGVLGLSAVGVPLVRAVPQKGRVGGELKEALDRIDAALARLNSVPTGHVVTMNAPKANGAIGRAVLRHSAADDDFNAALARAMQITR